MSESKDKDATVETASESVVKLAPEMALALVQTERDYLITKGLSELDRARADLDRATGQTESQRQDFISGIQSLRADQERARADLERAMGQLDGLRSDQARLQGAQRALRRAIGAWQGNLQETLKSALRESQVRALAGQFRPAEQVVLPKDMSPSGLGRWAPGRGRAVRERSADYNTIAASALFDAQWYLQAYPDVAEAGMDPALHYLLRGGIDARSPGPLFDAPRYLAANPDVAAAGHNPLLHFLRHGIFEGRPLGLPSTELLGIPTFEVDEPSPDAPPASGDVRKLNEFVYDQCGALGLPDPDIPVFLVEQYGQCAEDLIVRALLEAWASKQGVDLTKATYLEIGGNHPVATSASFLLHRALGMSGVVIEANPDLVPALTRVRNFDQVVFGAMQAEDVDTVMLSVSYLSELSSLDPSFVQNWAGGSVGERGQVEVPALRINTVIDRYFGGVAPQFLSIDIESLDLPVMQDLDFARFRPVVIQAEPSDHHCPGNTQAMIDFMRGKDYVLVAKTPVNLIFMAAEALAQAISPPRAASDAWKRYFAADYLHEEPWSYDKVDDQAAEALDNRLGQLWLTIKDGHKWLNYFAAYEQCFGAYVGQPCRVLEIGVNKGASLELWKRYFGDASSLVGIDILPECAQYEDAARDIHVRIGSQADPEFLARVVAEFGPFDIIIDDGSHVASHQIAAFNALFLSALKDGGVYLIEDVETAYWGSRTGQLDIDFSIVDYANAVVNLMHRPYRDHDYPFFLHENLGGQALSVPRLTKHVDQVRFFDSIVVFNKKARHPPVVKYIYDGAA
ncbi:MAG TPA: FkbM family methyltransferase [Caulobacteraceae bacterium]|nr:FkbM family methyltransferase [Caulobacteraceae bacterium]